jgi:di/tricarboxylate transporter
MSYEALIVVGVVALAVFLFIWDRFSVDLVALSLLAILTVSGVLTAEEAIGGFSNSATLTVAFMFVLSNALLKTGSLQRIGPKLGAIFSRNFHLGMFLMILFVGVSSAFINNTPIVAMFIPVMQSVANQTKISSSKLLIPLSYASIFGGTCTLIGTSTNILVSGIAQENGIEGISIFTTTPLGVILLIFGAVYLFFFGRRNLPDRGAEDPEAFNIRDYITEIEILEGSQLVGKKILESAFHREVEVDIIEIKRDETILTLPPGDFIFQAGDILKIRSNIDKIKSIKDVLRVDFVNTRLKIGESPAPTGGTTILELVITSGSEFEGKTLRSLDFRRSYRAIPLAIIHKEETVNEKLYDIELKAGDLIVIEIKTHRVQNLKRREMSPNSPFLILTEEGIIDFDRKKFLSVVSVIGGVVLLSALNVLPIVSGVIVGTIILVGARVMSMKEVYQSIDWRIVFLLAGTLSLGVAMSKTGLSDEIAGSILAFTGDYGPIAVLAALYLVTSLLTELMSNNATAALFAPIAIATATQLEVSPIPFLVTIMIAASASFMTPIGYQTNAMVYSAGRYRFRDFFKAGVWLNLMFWILSVLLIPILFPF